MASEAALEIFRVAAAARKNKQRSSQAVKLHLEKLNDAKLDSLYRELRSDIRKSHRAKERQIIIAQITGSVCQGDCFR